MDYDKPEVVFALDVEMVEGMINGCRTNVAGRVVLVRSDPKLVWIKVLDTYIKYEPRVVTNYMTKWSRLEPWMLDSGVDRDTAVTFFLHAVNSHKLVTFSGAGDFASLGLSPKVVRLFTSEMIELQEYFVRPDGRPYGLGPLVEYFGYQRAGRPVIIRHNCIDDAQFTLRLYLDHYGKCENEFHPERYIMNKKEYNSKYGIV